MKCEIASSIMPLQKEKQLQNWKSNFKMPKKRQKVLCRKKSNEVEKDLNEKLYEESLM